VFYQSRLHLTDQANQNTIVLPSYAECKGKGVVETGHPILVEVAFWFAWSVQCNRLTANNTTGEVNSKQCTGGLEADVLHLGGCWQNEPSAARTVLQAECKVSGN
jgi:hypothetical protein